MKVLFVCKGNVGRSQMAEAIFNKLAGGKHRAFSAGTWVYDKEGRSLGGQKISEVLEANEVVNSLKELGIDFSQSQRNQITPEMVMGADVIVVMAEVDTVPDFLKNEPKVTFWDVANPKGMNQEETNKIRNKITENIQELLTKLNG